MARLRVREVAEARGWTAAKLARRADLGYTTVLRIWNDETADPGVQPLAAIARVLGVRTGDLIVDEDVPPAKGGTESGQDQITKAPALAVA